MGAIIGFFLILLSPLFLCLFALGYLFRQGAMLLVNALWWVRDENEQGRDKAYDV